MFTFLFTDKRWPEKQWKKKKKKRSFFFPPHG